MAVAVSALGMGWKSTPRGPGPGTDRKSAPNVRGELSGSCWMPEFKLESCSGAGFRLVPGTDWTSAPNGRGKLAGGCWLGGSACDSETMAGSGTMACGATVSSKLEDDLVESSFMEFSSRSFPVALVILPVVVVALGPSSFVSRFKARRIRSSGACIHISI